jgi:hypothetical protein
MKKQIDFSNSKAAKNRNKYPIQEQATQMEIWELVPCTCDAKCPCKKFGCTHHWKLKETVCFEDFLNGFLRTFVYKNLHKSLINALEKKDPSKLHPRVSEAYHVLKSLKDKDVWKVLSEKAATHNKTLFCNEWAGNFREDWAFSVGQTSVYEAKKNCLLFPDICVPYDINSRRKLNSRYQLTDDDYFTFLSKIRASFMKCMEEERMTLQSLRCLDSPGDNLNFPEDNLPFDKKLITLPRAGLDYGTDYLPKERQLSFVLDKCYYQP